MVYYWFFVVLLLTDGASCKSHRIVGGHDTTIENHPSMVQLEFYYIGGQIWEQMCGANILTSRWLLTAAHCFDWTWHKLTRIRAGSTYRETGGVVHYTERVINHPEYAIAARKDADIALMRIRTPLVYSTSVQPGTIVEHGDLVPDNYPVVYAGWGTTKFEGEPSYILQEVTVNVVNNAVCAERFFELRGNVTVTSNMICAGLLDEGGKDACYGDSGGPLYSGNVIVGIVAFGEGCANGTYPGVNTSVASYTNWIIENAR